MQLSFDRAGTLLLARFESAPAVVHVFAFPSAAELQSHTQPAMPRLRSVLVHGQNVVGATWNPIKPGTLAVCTASEGVYVWHKDWVGEVQREDGQMEEVTQETAECIGVPTRESLR